jgi:hypothetical protein
MHADLAGAARHLSLQLPALEVASDESERIVSVFKRLLPEECPCGGGEGTDWDIVDVVLLGANARGEYTKGSDCDYFVLSSGAPPDVTRALIRGVDRIARDELILEPPGGHGAFARVVSAIRLYESIGLEDDTNVNMTQRLLILTESKSVYSEAMRQAVIGNILSRYCLDPPGQDPGESAKVPRFLLNDLVRYWRTMAVDFGAKRWRSAEDDYHLRLAKLKTSRKILFAGPLATLLLVPVRVQRSEDLPGYLQEWLDKPPLAQLASTVGHLSERSREALAGLLNSYDKFINILNRDRKLFYNPESKRFSELEEEVRGIANSIQESLQQIFYEDNLFASAIRKYGIF